MNDARFDLCVCGFPRWRHPMTEDARKTLAWTTSAATQPHHFFIETDDVVVTRRGKGGRFEKVPR